MAITISVLGAAAGLASLGMSACRGVMEWWENRKEDLKHTNRLKYIIEEQDGMVSDP